MSFQLITLWDVTLSHKTIKQGGKNKHNITRYDTNVKCVLILDMVPTGTEICLEVEIPYVGPNDGER